MNGNKWVAAAIITVVILVLVAILLGMILIFKTAQAWGGRESDISLGDIFEPQQAVEEPPMEAPAEIEQVDLEGSLGILVVDEGDHHLHILESFAATCDAHGIPTNLFVGNGDPMVIFEAAISMLENDGTVGLAVCTTDPALTEELAALARDAYGVPVISIDAAMDAQRPQGVLAHIDGWGSVEDIAFKLLWGVADNVGEKSRFGVVTPFPDDPIAEIIRQQQKMYPVLEKMKWVASGHGDGTDESCRKAIIEMLEKNDLDALICAEPQTTNAAIIAMEELGMEIPIYGFTHPSMVADIGGTNVTAVWRDPKTVGELAARCLIGELTGTVTFANGEFVYVGNGDSYCMEELDGVLTMWVNPLWITKENADMLRDRE